MYLTGLTYVKVLRQAREQVMSCWQRLLGKKCRESLLYHLQEQYTHFIKIFTRLTFLTTLLLHSDCRKCVTGKKKKSPFTTSTSYIFFHFSFSYRYLKSLLSILQIPVSRCRRYQTYTLGVLGNLNQWTLFNKTWKSRTYTMLYKEKSSNS